MFYRLVFKKVLGKRTECEVPGYDLEKVTILTDSFEKRQELIEIYKNKDFRLIKYEDCDWQIPRGYNLMPVKSNWWMPDLEEYEKYIKFKDLAPQALKVEAPRIEEPTPRVAKPFTDKMVNNVKFMKRKSNYKCFHKFNCDAHRDICVSIYGLEPIYTKPIL